MTRHDLALLALSIPLVALACGPVDPSPPSGPAPGVCQDEDGDGFGPSCGQGLDCDDRDAKVTNECYATPDGSGDPWKCTNGDVADCVIEVAAGPGMPLCLWGERACIDESWGPCEVVEDAVADNAVEPAAFSTASTCNSPCDPSCQVWTEDPAGATTPGSTTTSMPGGSLSALPAGHVKKLLKEPCDGPEDCMCDHYCDSGSGACEPYLPGDFNSCGGADLTMPVPCDGQVWVCNRGDQPAPSGLIVAIINGNSNQLQKSVGQCSGLEGTLNKTCSATTQPINPGECIDVAPLCGALPNGTKHVVVNSGDYPPTVGECDCGQNHCAMKNGATNACAAISGYEPLVHQERYEADCGPGQSVQWGYLAYQASTPSNAGGTTSLTIEAHTAATVAELSATCADCVTVAEVPASEPESCPLSGAPPCPINLVEQLGWSMATEPILELVFTLAPSPDGQLGPDLTAWEVTYSCVDSE